MADKWKNIGEGMGGALVIAGSLLTPFLRNQRVKWGAATDEINGTLPGDDLIPHPKWQYTNAITVNAPTTDVWPWLVQIGQGRGGWYSYDALEAIAGAANFTEGHSARCILPELQDLKIGDRIWMHDRILPLTVAAMEPERFLVFLTRVDIRTKSYFELDDGLPEHYVNSSWTFFLESPETETTRLLVRSRLDYSPNLVNDIAWRVFTDPISFIMERKMLLTLKRIAETSQKVEPGGFEPPTF